MENIDYFKFGATKLEDISVLHIEGEFDSVIELLQGQVTSDCSLLSDSFGQISALCDEKGYILCNFDILIKNKSILIIILSELEEVFIQEITKFAPFYKVSIKPLNTQVIGIAKHKDEKVLPNEQKILEVEDINLYLLLGEKVTLNDMQPIKNNNWYINRKILRDHIIKKSDLGKYRPHELMQDKLRISFKKGCFRGQEIISRMEYRGKQKKLTELIVHDLPSDIEKYQLIGESIKFENKLFSSCLRKK